jgi:hypothetical protein
MERIECPLPKTKHFAQNVLLMSSCDAYTTSHPCYLAFGWHLAPTLFWFAHKGHYGRAGHVDQG